MKKSKKELSIVHINTHDLAGGAAKVAWRLAEAQRKTGHDSRMLIGTKNSDTEHSSAFPIEHDSARQSYCYQNGQLFYDLQGSHKLLANPIVKSADIVHLHNLHGGYFNPFSLSALSNLKPLVWTLHDMQAITGHCAHSFDCQRWQTGCGQCPYLNIEPAIKIDTSAQLLRDKKIIYDHSHLWLVTPSQWLKNKVEKSILQNHPVKLIYNSVDTNTFRPYDKAEARNKLGIPLKALVIGAVAHGGALTNQWKGGNYTQAALDTLGRKIPEYVFANIGGDYETGDPRIINIPHIDNESELAQVYSTIDIFLNTSIADNCPLVILEALSCGIPVVSFDTGGIPELVRNGMDGYITKAKNIAQLVQAVESLAANPRLLAKFGLNARERATSSFDTQIISKQYENLYQQVLKESKTKKKEVKLFPINKIPKVIMTKAFEQAEKYKIDFLRTETGLPTQNRGYSQIEIDVSIVLCTKDRAILLDQMLTSLKDSIKGINCEVIVIDGNSSDKTQEVLHKHGITKIYNEVECLGPGKHSWPQLYNFGFSKARGKWAMYASDDIVFGKECIANAVKLLNKQNEEVAGGIFFYKNTHSEPGWDIFGIDFTYGPKLLMNYGLIRLDYFRQVGGLDEAYRFYCADGDLCFKLYENDKQFIPLPECFIVHNNILDYQKNSNVDKSRNDIELYAQRWRHFVSTEIPKPRRLLWQKDSVEVFNLPFNLKKIDQGIEFFWHGLACFQQGLFEQAKFRFFLAIKSSSCDHWHVLWYLAKTAHKCNDIPLSEKAVRTVIKLAPDFIEAQNLLKQLGCNTRQYAKQRIVGITNNKVKTIDYNNETLKQIKESGLWNEGAPLRLHLGCGQQHFDNYINIDYPPSEHNIMRVKADIYADIKNLDFPPESVDEIRLHHVFEHFNRVTALAMLIKWHKWLKIGGRIHIETPDLIGSAKTLVSNASLKTKMGVVRHLAGDQAAGWGYHVDHWFGERFEHTLRTLGFEPVQTWSTSWTKEPYLANIQVVAVKTRDSSLQQQLTAAEKLLYESTVAAEEKPTWETWRKQLHIILKSDFISSPSNIDTPDVSSISQTPAVLPINAQQLPLDEIHNFNQRTRDQWVRTKAKTVPAGSRILDVGAGTCPYRSFFAHCEYKTHDLKKLKGGHRNGIADYGHIDYVSDICNIPVTDNSFDVILCTEVLEHVPEPIEALREMTRIVRPGGRILITAPLGSGLHQTPYHYYGGYSPQWYKHFLSKFGSQVKEITPNGGFFRLLAQECARVAWTLPQHHHLHGNNVDFIRYLFKEWLPRYLFVLEESCFIDQFTVGYHVEAVKIRT